MLDVEVRVHDLTEIFFIRIVYCLSAVVYNTHLEEIAVFLLSRVVVLKYHTEHRESG